MFIAKERGPGGEFFDDDDTTVYFEGHDHEKAQKYVDGQNAAYKANWADSPEMANKYDEYGGRWGLIGIKRK